MAQGPSSTWVFPFFKSANVRLRSKKFASRFGERAALVWKFLECDFPSLFLFYYSSAEMSIYRHFTVDEALSLVLTASEDQYLAPSAESESNADTSASDDDSDGEEIRVSRSAVPLSAAVVGVSTSLHGDVPDGSEPCDAPGSPREDDGDERSLQYWEGDVDTDKAVHEFVLKCFFGSRKSRTSGGTGCCCCPYATGCWRC